MSYQSKTYSLSDEVVAAIDAARAQGETPNRFLRRVLGLDRPRITEVPDIDMSETVIKPGFVGAIPQIDIELSRRRSGGKATTETVRRGIRQKGDGKR